MSKKVPLETHKKGVRAPYTWRELKHDVRDMRRLKSPKSPDRRMSFREIAARFGVSHGVIQRVLKGIEPKTPAIREALGLTTMLPAPACPKCNTVHVAERCPNEPRRRTRHSDKRIADMPPSVLAWKIRNREVME